MSGARPLNPSAVAQWSIVALLALIAAGLWLRPDAGSGVALAQGQALAGARGVFAFTGPLDREQYGLFMLDVDQGTIWCYAFDKVDGVSKLRLVAARTWMYDRYLQDFNNAPPDFRMVQNLVSQQRAQTVRELPQRDEAPTEPATPGEDGRPDQ